MIKYERRQWRPSDMRLWLSKWIFSLGLYVYHIQAYTSYNKI